MKLTEQQLRAIVRESIVRTLQENTLNEGKLGRALGTMALGGALTFGSCSTSPTVDTPPPSISYQDNDTIRIAGANYVAQKVKASKGLTFLSIFMSNTKRIVWVTDTKHEDYFPFPDISYYEFQKSAEYVHPDWAHDALINSGAEITNPGYFASFLPKSFRKQMLEAIQYYEHICCNDWKLKFYIYEGYIIVFSPYSRRGKVDVDSIGFIPIKEYENACKEFADNIKNIQSIIQKMKNAGREEEERILKQKSSDTHLSPKAN